MYVHMNMYTYMPRYISLYKDTYLHARICVYSRSITFVAGSESRSHTWMAFIEVHRWLCDAASATCCRALGTFGCHVLGIPPPLPLVLPLRPKRTVQKQLGPTTSTLAAVRYGCQPPEVEERVIVSISLEPQNDMAAGGRCLSQELGNHPEQRPVKTPWPWESGRLGTLRACCLIPDSS